MEKSAFNAKAAIYSLIDPMPVTAVCGNCSSVRMLWRYAKEWLASYADVLRLVTRSSPRTSALRMGHFRSLAVSLCFKRTNPLFC